VFQGPQAVAGGVRFTLEAPYAQDVRITGVFCDWSYDGLPLERNGEGLWSCVVEIGPGSYEYRFIIDGVWVKDPNNFESITNDFGVENSVVVV
jgi:1,4-alpha-glucan branching enzyme